MNMMEWIRQRVAGWKSWRRERLEGMRQHQLELEARHVVQVMEYKGGLYVCLDGVPMVEKDELKGTLEEEVAKAREVYKDWKEEARWKRRGNSVVSGL